MNVLVICEFSAVVKDAFARKGHNTWSCDLMPSANPVNHHKGDVVTAVEIGVLSYTDWDLIIAHPPCTYLCSSGLHWNKRTPGREEKTLDALKFVEWIWSLPCEKLCLENPVGCINTRLNYMPKPQYIQPYEFGHNASKKTGLWLRGLPRLISTNRIKGRIVDGNERFGNQTDSGQNKLGPSKTRAAERAVTYQGVADAMAEQWG